MLGLFALDLQTIGEAIKPGALATVSARSTPQSGAYAAANPRLAADAVNPVGQSAAEMLTPDMRKVLNFQP
ncbi:MAG: hypothetical protein AAGJ87_00720 [Pseudomonadota bacterium]